VLWEVMHECAVGSDARVCCGKCCTSVLWEVMQVRDELA
jgi:hypothetical protein